MESKIVTSPATAVNTPVIISDLCRLYTSIYIEFEFSNSSRFRSTDLVFATDGTIKIEGSHDGKYWGLALTSTNDGNVTISVANGDYERVSIDGSIDQIKFTPTGITGATHYRAIVTCI